MQPKGASGLLDARSATRAGVGELQTRLFQTLARHIPPGDDVALIAHPPTQNVGDHAIFLGQLAYLREANNRIAYLGGLDYFSPRELHRRLPRGGVVVLYGGGNFGDLYPHHHDLRLRVLADARDFRVVQLPQTINFRDDASAAATAEAIARHPHFTMLVRDEVSLERASAQLRIQAELCPDMAFALGSRPRPRVTQQAQWLRRADSESGALAETSGSPPGVDWAEVAELSVARRLQRRELTTLVTLANRDGRMAARLHDRLAALTERAATVSFNAGIDLIGAGNVLTTDRLHAHLLATLCGVPNVVVSDRFGKVRGAYETWTQSFPIVRLADSPEAARAAASDLMREFSLS